MQIETAPHPNLKAPMAELVDALDLESSAARRVSSTLTGGTKYCRIAQGERPAFQADEVSSILTFCSKQMLTEQLLGQLERCKRLAEDMWFDSIRQHQFKRYQMNYKKLYDSIVTKAQLRYKPDGYYETHHIIPRSLGGSDDTENLVCVTAKEHFILHYLLTKITEGDDRRKMLHAFMLMAGSNENQDRYINSRLYDSKKIEFAESQRQRFTGVLKTEEHKQKISKTLTGKVTSEETKQKQSESASRRKRKPFSPEYRAAMSAKMREVKAKNRDCSSVG